ncbi:integration host factor subunit alpha [Wolbachia endosymbiont of Ctenocephalides felis wCfeJ]|uniref:integration host factor subunit alpha n=1 Tax=Wolbachia endosymbiont of Ctenocephalides felis wCfeJ TaxID=2732594 RepID=UPI0014483FFE|nr:integration host factor subunit alpha [Wolbachia endosymbiont of Ctenocephalides felis wCfeJ]WCR57645.1 MAG: Integration host factor subunit alpha [Wolbachia endosymbiont of Ctenocephalides felis wCfeJ]
MDYVITKDTTVTKAIIAEGINQEIGLSKEDSSAIIDDILDEIKIGLVKDGIVKIASFGTFLVKKKKERPGNIPKTPQKVMIQARNIVSFRPSKVIKKLINE